MAARRMPMAARSTASRDPQPSSFRATPFSSLLYEPPGPRPSSASRSRQLPSAAATAAPAFESRFHPAPEMNPGIVALIGERDPAKPAHTGIEACFALFQRLRPDSLTFRWVPTRLLTPGSAQLCLADACAVWCTPGSPYENTLGALEAIRHARVEKKPFLGTCGGFQHALMEYCANVLERPAIHQELDGQAVDPLIMKLSCSLAGTKARVLAPAQGWYARTVGATDSIEDFNCNYGLSPGFEPLFAGSELKFVARDEQGQVRAFRLANHPFFVGTLFQPERRAIHGSLHPLVQAFLNFS